MSLVFGDFELDQERRLLLRSDEPVPLEPKAYELLCLLVDRRPRALSRAQIRDAVWPETFISESTLGVVVNGLRQALDDDAREPRFIRTVRGFGYAFCGDVRDEARGKTGPIEEGLPAQDWLAPEEPPPARRAPRLARLGPLLVIGALGACGLAAWLISRGGDPRPPQITRFTMHLSRELADFGNLAIAPDGSRIAFVAKDAHGVLRVYVRELDSFESTPLAGTEGASALFFSPDGRWVAFEGRNGVLKKVSVRGGPPIDLGRVPNVGAATWGSDGTIVVQADSPPRIWAISATGKGARPLEVLDGENARWLLPLQFFSERELLMASWDEDNPTVDLVSLDTGERRPVLRAFVDPSAYRLLPSGHFVWASGGALLAARLDLEGGALAGPPVTVAEGLRTYLGVGHNVALSDTGTLVYAPSAGPQESRLVWVDREGRTTPISGAGGASPFFRRGLSPDGREAAVTLVEGNDRDIWIFDLERGTRRRLTAEGVNHTPVWDPTGAWIAFGSTRGGLEGVFRKRSDGTGEDDLLFENPASPYPVAWSPDGRTLAILPFGRPEIWLHSIDGETSTVVKDAGGWPMWAFSPDWRWLAFQSDETGRAEIYVQPFPGPGPRTVVSTSGGTRPAWAPSGGELFYHDENRVMAVRLETRRQLRVGTPRLLFEGPYWEGLNVSPDGERFLMLREEDQGPITELRVVVNWGEELKRLVP